MIIIEKIVSLPNDNIGNLYGMEKATIKGIPYGVARFDEVRNENFYYVDKTMYLPLLENTSKYLFLIRPRRFGACS